jgi:hypothetical protein
MAEEEEADGAAVDAQAQLGQHPSPAQRPVRGAGTSGVGEKWREVGAAGLPPSE